MPPNRAEPEAEAFGLYVHIPFCIHKCPYCDFNTYAGLDGLMDDYVAALCRELARAARLVDGRKVTSVFLGGGTPTILAAGQLRQIFDAIGENFALGEGAEITSEANPGTVDEERFAVLAELGVNRLSLGAQSFVSSELAFLGRQHTADETARALSAARSAGFDNVNLDLIFGLPAQTAADLAQSLARLVELGPDHISAYSLIVEPDTPLGHAVRTGRQAPPDDDVVAELYEQVVDTLGGAGYAHYEISNWARNDRVARHNLLYWHNGEYLGVGPGAHSHLRFEIPRADAGVSRRWANLKPVPHYIKRLAAGEPIEAFSETLDAPTAMGETMMLGLRLVREGVPKARFLALHGVDMDDVFGPQLQRMFGEGWLELAEDRVRATAMGLRFHSHVSLAFMPDE